MSLPLSNALQLTHVLKSCSVCKERSLPIALSCEEAEVKADCLLCGPGTSVSRKLIQLTIGVLLLSQKSTSSPDGFPLVSVKRALEAESWNPRLVCVGKDLKIHPLPTPCHGPSTRAEVSVLAFCLKHSLWCPEVPTAVQHGPERG